MHDVDATRWLASPRWSIEPRSRDERAGLGRQEWLLTDGLGGFAMGTVSGVPSRRYHSLLTVSVSPPLERELLWHSIQEIVWVHPDDPRCYPVDLSAAVFDDGTRLDGAGPRLLRFELGPDGMNAARWVFDLGDGGRLTKTLELHEYASAATVTYSAEGVRAWIDARPLMGLRDFHGLNAFEDHGVRVTHAADERSLWISRQGIEASLELVGEQSRGAFKVGPHWWHGFRYAHEADRGFDATEHLFCPGSVHLSLLEDCSLRVGAGEPGAAAQILADGGWRTGAVERSARLRSSAESVLRLGVGTEADDRAVVALATAADQFVVRRAATPALARDAGSLVSILAGYPWFGDWGRDSMIALPGLLLVTGRHEEASRVLETFARAQRNGLIPNRFADDGTEPEYNTADASLWFLHACDAFRRATQSHGTHDQLCRDVLLPACMDVVEGYVGGAPGGIGVDDDGLVFAGAASTQLTWMDAARDGVVFTPRHGKPVELQALWHHGLVCLSRWVGAWDSDAAGTLRARADRCRRGVAEHMWSDRLGCLVDCLRPTDRGWIPVEEIRPNQVFAASLEFGPLDEAQRTRVVRTCLDRLCTPMGLRTLDPADPSYRGRYAGPMFERDAAYHQGTSWPWLLGPMAEAVLRAGSFDAESCEVAHRIVEPLIDAMLSTDSASPGQVFEVYDGETAPEPQSPGGCPAQAWSVSELLRVLSLLRSAGGARAV